MKWAAVLSCVLYSCLAQEDKDLKAVNPTPLYYASYYPGYYPGFRRGLYPGYYNPYNRFGYMGYNPYNLLANPLRQAYAPIATPPASATAMETQGSQFHFQDGLGNINYGYSNVNSAKQEVGNTYTGVKGQYSYVDANGIQQVVSYVADDNGFRVISDSRLNSIEGYALPPAADQGLGAPGAVVPVEPVKPLAAVPADQA